jgi:SAM-dependent methyltransferase
VKLHIGAGNHPLPGWVNSDLNPCHPDILRLDATLPMPFPPAHFDHIFSEHMIEHVPYAGGVAMLRECYRILKPGGKVRISAPDLDFLVRLTTSWPRLTWTELNYVQWQCSHFPGMPVCAATVLNNSIRRWGHEFIYSPSLLGDAMAACGFVEITRWDVPNSDDSELRGLEHQSRMPPGMLALETMAVQGTKQA